MPKLLVISADKRQFFMTEYLNKNGYDCVILSPEKKEITNGNMFDGLILPLPGFKGEKINCNFDLSISEILPLIKEKGVIFCGMAGEKEKAFFEENNIRFFDYYRREDFLYRNAFLTAQGMMKMLLDDTDKCLSELKILVGGYGKTGEAVADILKRNYCDVTVAVRKIRDKARLKNNNIKSLFFDEINEKKYDFDYVINTVPQTVFDEERIRNTGDNTVFFELASKPYGIDFQSAEKLGRRVVSGSSLPGKHVCFSAGEVIGKAVKNIIEEEKLWKK